MTKLVNRGIICLACVLLIASSIYAQPGSSTSVDKEKTKTETQVTEKSVDNQSVKSILTEMDSRMNKESLLTVIMEVIDGDSLTEYKFLMKAKDNNQFLLLRYLSPDRWKNTDILMISEDIWIYDRNSDRFMQVPRSLAFGGTDIAHGDMMRLNISNNYDGEIIAEDDETWVLNLTSHNRNMPYYNIELTINKEWYYPIRAELYSKSKKHIKTVEYTEVQELNGTMKPTKYTFYSPYEPDKYNIVKIIDEELKEYPDYIFNIWAIRSGLDENY